MAACRHLAVGRLSTPLLGQWTGRSTEWTDDKRVLPQKSANTKYAGHTEFKQGGANDHKGLSRDAYSLMLGKYGSSMDIKLQNVTGEWVTQSVHDDVFRLWDLSAKMCLVLTHNANPAVPVSQPVMQDLKHLQKVHHPDNTYRLMSRLAMTKLGFEAGAAVVALPNSPFKMSDMVNAVQYKRDMRYRAATNVNFQKFLDRSGGKYAPFGDALCIDGFLHNKKAGFAAAIATGPPTLNGMLTSACMKAYIHTDEFMQTLNSTDQSSTANGWDQFLVCPNQIWFYACDVIASENVPTIVEKAKEEGFDILARDPVSMQLRMIPAASIHKPPPRKPRPLTRDGD